MTFRYLDKDGAISFWTNIKNFVLSKIPTKTSELTNDSGFLTQHQSLSNYVTLNSSQTISGAKTFSSTITGSISGNAGTATQFSANKSVTLTGDVTGTASSKAGWSVSTTLSNSGVTAGTYGPSEDVTGNNNATISVPEITVDSKGRVTSVTNRTLTCKNNTYNVYNKTLTIQKNGTNVATFTSNSNTNVTANITVPTKTSELTNDSNFLTTSSSLNASKLTGTIDIARLPQGALERVITVANQTARFALTTSSVQLGDTVKQLDTGVMYVVVNESKLNSNDGYLEYTAGSASSVPWSGITSKPTKFTPSSHTHTKSEITDFPTNVSAFTNDSGYLTSHQSLSNYVTLNTAQEITNTKTFKDATTARKLTSVEAGNVIPTSDKLISDIWQDKNGKELGRIYYSKTKGGNTALIMRAGDYFSESEGVYSLNTSGTNRRAELHLYSDSSGNCCIKPVGYFSTTLKALSTSVWLGESTKPFGRVYANAFEFCNAGLLPDTDVQTSEEHSIGFYGQNNTPLSYITFQKRPNLKDRIAVRVQTAVSAYKSYCFDATCFYPESNNNLDIGSTTNIFKNIYCNNYYKGTTAFGDIVTHNASEFLTSHQSLANYVTTNTSQSISGIKTFPTNIDLANTSTSQREYWALKFSKTDTNGTGASQLGVFQPSNSSDFVACLRLGNPRGDNKPTAGTGVNTGNCWSGIGVYYNYALNRGYPYAPNCNSWGDSSNADAELASTAWVRRYCETTKGYLTSHQSLANYVTTNTDQTITGVKTFSDDTFIKSLNFTNEVPSPSSSSVSIMPIITTITYGDSSPSVQARLNLRVTADGAKSLYPHENNQYSLGLLSRRWSSFFGYFVNLGGVYLGNEASPNQRTNLYLLANRDTDGQSGAYITRFRQNRAQGALQSNDFQKIGIDVLENGVRTNDIFDIQCTDWLNDVPQKVNFVSSATSYSYGKSSNKALINDLNPSSLFLPDIANKIDISSYITNLAGDLNNYTPTVNGWICIQTDNSSVNNYIRCSYDVIMVKSSGNGQASTLSCLIPVIANNKVGIRVVCTTLSSAYFIPCQGNV